MSKIIIEVNEELKEKFLVKCIKSKKSQKETIINLIEKWLKTK